MNNRSITQSFHLLLIASVSLVLSSCEFFAAAEETTITGQVRTYGTDEGVVHPPIKIELYKSGSGEHLLSPTSYSKKAETWTNENGRYTINRKLYAKDSYYLKIDESTVKRSYGYVPPSNVYIDENPITRTGGVYKKNLYLHAYGRVRFHFISDTAQPGDVYSYSAGGESGTFYGSVNTTKVIRFQGNQEHCITLYKNRNGVLTDRKEYFFVRSFDIVDHEVRF